VGSKHIAKSTRLGWGAPPLVTFQFLLFGLLPACIPLGQAQAVGKEGDSLASCGAQGLVDDCEDGNNQTKVVEGRGGYWYTFTEGHGTTVVPQAGAAGGNFAMSPGGVNGSKYAARARGRVAEGEIVFGALGLNFADPKGLYDASRYKGIAFWAKRGPDSSGIVRFNIPDVSTDQDGGICKECFNDFGADIELSEGWQHFVFPWRRLKQLPGWGLPRPHAIKPNKLYGLQWQARQPGADFDIWIDDVELIGCE
jgi:endoglucanase